MNRSLSDSSHNMSDIEQPILSQNQNNNNNNPRLSVANANSNAVRQNLNEELRNTINHSIIMNLIFIFFAIGKILTSMIILFGSNTTCNQPLVTWIINMIIYDLIYILCLLYIIYQILYTNHQEQRYSTSTTSSIYDNNYNNINDLHYPEEINAFNMNERIQRKNKYISFIIELIRIYYVILFIYGQIIYNQEDSNCAIDAPALNSLVFIYIVFGYLYFGIPIIILFLACLCMPFLIALTIIFSRRAQKPASKINIEKLPIIKFQSELPGCNECSICMQEYIENENVIQLKCSPMHHFHADCLKKWLNINGLCPICRAPIGEDREQEMMIHH